ncbi:unnamed protein product [Urochloa humidicola]
MTCMYMRPEESSTARTESKTRHNRFASSQLGKMQGKAKVLPPSLNVCRQTKIVVPNVNSQRHKYPYIEWTDGPARRLLSPLSCSGPKPQLPSPSSSPLSLSLLSLPRRRPAGSRRAAAPPWNHGGGSSPRWSRAPRPGDGGDAAVAVSAGPTELVERGRAELPTAYSFCSRRRASSRGARPRGQKRKEGVEPTLWRREGISTTAPQSPRARAARLPAARPHRNHATATSRRAGNRTSGSGWEPRATASLRAPADPAAMGMCSASSCGASWSRRGGVSGGGLRKGLLGLQGRAEASRPPQSSAAGLLPSAEGGVEEDGRRDGDIGRRPPGMGTSGGGGIRRDWRLGIGDLAGCAAVFFFTRVVGASSRAWDKAVRYRHRRTATRGRRRQIFWDGAL